MKPLPALLTRMSSLPKCAAAPATAAGDLIELGNIHLQGKSAAAHGFDFACEITARCECRASRGRRRLRRGRAREKWHGRDRVRRR